jgi:diadenosine tetraphosphate (Ap4A) HIT family hydrolase
MCPICKIVYGAEDPKCEELGGSKNFLAVVDTGNRTRPYIIVLPKRPETSLTDIAREDGEAFAEFEKLALEAVKKYKEKYQVKSFVPGNLAVPCGKTLHQYLVFLPATQPKVEGF